MFPPSSERQRCQKDFLKGGTFCVCACWNSCKNSSSVSRAPCCICSVFVWEWWIQTPVVELLTPVTPAALSVQFASRGSTVSCCLEADRVDQLQVLSVVEKVLVSSQRRDGQFMVPSIHRGLCQEVWMGNGHVAEGVMG